MTKFLKEYQFILLGIIGALITLYGNMQDYPHKFYIVGALMLFTVAIHYRLLYFIALEIILAVGHLAIILGMSTYTLFALPILLCFQLLMFYLMIGKENSIFLFIGVIGIALLSIGFSYNNQWIFFSGSLSIAIYAYYSVALGNFPSYIWAVLNTIYVFSALYRLHFL